MTKPDPIPKFVEIRSSAAIAQAVVPAAEEAAEPLDWVDQFLADREIRPNTLKMYVWQLRRFQRWLKHKPWPEVTENDLTAYKNYLKMKPTRGGSTGLKPASINQALAAIQSFYKWLYVRLYVTFNPALTIEMATPSPPKPKDLEISTIHELDEGLAYRGQLCTRDTAIVWVLKHGLRASEISALNVGDYKEQALQVENAKWGSDGQAPLSPDACFAIESYLGWCLAQEFDMSPTAPLFRSQSNRNYGARMSYQGIYQMVKDLAAISGLTEESIHPHRYRHTFGTQMVLENVPPAFAQKLMRNKSMQSFDRYTKWAVEKKAADAFKQVVEQSASGLFGSKAAERPSEHNQHTQKND